jgi:hypothetical protein
VPSPTFASVIVLRIQEFTRRPVLEQTRLKGELEALVGLAIRPLPAGDRIVLEMPDGAAVVVLGGPRAALETAERAQAAAADLPLCIAANYGAIKPASDALRGRGLMGDGLAAGVTLATVAAPGRLLVSRAFRDNLDAHAPERAAGLSPVGVFTDPNVRTHELFALDWSASHARHRRLITIGALSAAAIIGLGVAARGFLREAPSRPAIVAFEITPRGDVVVDGIVKGKSPPLTRLEISPGPHNIEVRNAAFPPLHLDVDLGPGEEMTIRHSFARPKPAPRSRSAGDQFRNWWRGLGF